MPEELDEQSLFDAAVSDEPEVQVADEVPEKPDAGHPRDEAGKFAKADEPPNEPEKPVVDDNDAMPHGVRKSTTKASACGSIISP